MDTPSTNTTRDQLLDYAQKLIRTRGCNGFSYRDLADHVGVKTSSVHYYFPCKDDLLYEAVENYTGSALETLRGISPTLPAKERLDAYIAMVESHSCQADQLCLGGMLAAELNTLPERVRAALQAFFTVEENWLAKVLADGAREGTLRYASTPEKAARAVRHGAGLSVGRAPVPAPARSARSPGRAVRPVRRKPGALSAGVCP